jgi:hypothetical protein
MRSQRGFCSKLQDILKLVIVSPGAALVKFKDIHYRCRGKAQKEKQKCKKSYNKKKLRIHRNALMGHLTFPHQMSHLQIIL